ncbi:uncharacterized protein isoform X2 [Danio rerio]|uniref:Uncharacterized protein isoform X2 n=1 Tax=Danio rerio TaxID=7955 RepID=A0AC58GBX3_DANRE
MDQEGDNDVLRSARHLLSLLTRQERDGPSTSQDMNRSSQVVRPRVATPGPSSVQSEMTRSFPGLFTNRRGKRRFTGTGPLPIKPKPFQVTFHLLPGQCERSPSSPDQLLHTQAGLGRRTAMLDENMTHQELCDKLIELYPKLGGVMGGWLLYKASGGWGSRKLVLMAPADCGYTGRLIKATKIGENSVLYIAPLQDELDTAPLPPSSEAFRDMPKAICKKCNESYPLQLLTNHIKSCTDVVVVEDENESQDEYQQEAECENKDNEVKNNEQACCPICQEVMPFGILEVHASECGESPVNDDSNNTAEFSFMNNEVNNTADFSIMDNDWKTHLDPKTAALLYRKQILQLHETGKPLFMSMDLRSSVEEQDRQLINFYKQRNVEWACPVKCQLQDAAVGDGVSRHFFSTVLEKLKYGFRLNFGNTGVTCLFEGEADHLVPSSSQFLIESDLFQVAGRMLGHSFLHGGPCLAGLSRAFVHVLLGGSEDTATLQLEDCPDIDLRETINLLSGQSPLTEDAYTKILELCLSWDLPGPTDENRRWLYERLLSHAVIGRRTRQIKQIKRGLKDTFVWNLLTERKDVVFFPNESEDLVTSEMLLSHISWPTESDSEDDEYSTDEKDRITGYLKKFIETASAKDLKNLMKFWVGWERMEENMVVEIVKSDLPKSSTCFCVLRIPGHYSDYQSFVSDLMMCIGTCQYGFGHV